MSDKTIVVLATLDTKGVEAQYLKEQIEKMGAKALVVVHSHAPTGTLIHNRRPQRPPNCRRLPVRLSGRLLG